MSDLAPIALFVAGEPKGQPRPRAFARKFGDKWQARVYDAHTAEGWKGAIALELRPHAPAEPWEGPVSVEATFYMPRPKSHYGAKGLKPNAPVFHTSKPDRDNLDKALLDALTQVGMIRDDSQVCDGPVRKRYGAKSGVEILISRPLATTIRDVQGGLL